MKYYLGIYKIYHFLECETFRVCDVDGLRLNGEIVFIVSKEHPPEHRADCGQDQLVSLHSVAPRTLNYVKGDICRQLRVRGQEVGPVHGVNSGHAAAAVLQLRLQLTTGSAEVTAALRIDFYLSPLRPLTVGPHKKQSQSCSDVIVRNPIVLRECYFYI